MSGGLGAMLLGVFIVPVALLWGGHRMRRRSPRWHTVFWGAIAGHVFEIVAGSMAAMIPPEEWNASDTWRGLLGFWSFLVAPLLGAAIAALTSGKRRR
jgi:hypothetical protein